MVEQSEKSSNSPRWSSGLKLVVALTIAAIFVALLMRFRNIVGPLLITFVLAYLIYPLAGILVNKLKLKWPFAVTLLYLLIVILLLGLLTWGSLALIVQIQSFIEFLQKSIADLPQYLADLPKQIIIGGYPIDLSGYDLNKLLDPILNGVQPLLGQVGSLVSAVAGGAAEGIGWIAFILLVSYFILLESRGSSERIFTIEIPGFTEDFRQMGRELGKLWNAFLRGQFVVILINTILYTVLLTALGVRFAFGLALLAGLARFLPYIGPAIAWTTLGLVCYFQGGNYFGLMPFSYAVLTVAIAWFADLIMDNFVSTRILAKTLKIHPAAVLVMALIGANLIGLVGVILASPVTASLKLFGRYVTRKMFDQDPWEGLEEEEKPIPPPVWLANIQKQWSLFINRIRAWFRAK